MSKHQEQAVQPQQPEDITPVANTADQPARQEAGQEPVTLKGAAEAYLEHLSYGTTKYGTVIVYRKALDLAIAYFGADRRIDSITLPQVGKFYASDTLNRFPDGRPKAEPTVKQIKRVFRQCLEHARQQGWISILPIPKAELQHARIRGTSHETETVTAAEVNEPQVQESEAGPQN